MIDYISLVSSINELDVWICSFGGCGTNLVADYLASKGFQIHTAAWREYLCHFNTYIPTKTRVIYMYGDPIAALKSQKHRGLAEMNYKKLQIGKEEQDEVYTDDKMLSLMELQYTNWSLHRNNPHIFFLRYETLYDNVSNLANFLNLDLSDFPPQKARTSKKYTINAEKHFCHKYADFINNTD